MSASSLSLPLIVTGSAASECTEGVFPSLQPPVNEKKVVRRQPDMQQGRALEALGHAIEYLMDSRLFLVNEAYTPADTDAVQLLSRCSREVFATCAEIVPMHQRFKQWAVERLRSGAMHQASTRRV